jgi:hypothetical protein
MAGCARIEKSMNLLFILPAYEPAWAFGGIGRSNGRPAARERFAQTGMAELMAQAF